MSIRTFWTILLKILGLSLVLAGISLLPQSLSAIPSFFGSNSAENMMVAIWIIGLFLFAIGIYAVILWLFVFKTSWLIDNLHLEKGFAEERIDLHIRQSTILSVAVIVIGGIMLINALPAFCEEVFVLIQSKRMFFKYENSGYIIFYFAKAVIAYLLMTNSKLVVSFIDKNAKPTQENE